MIVPGTKFPEFRVAACVGIESGEEFRELSSRDLHGKWLVLYTYPKDFTFVCPTEIVELDSRLPDLEARNALLVGGSTDNEYSHLAWRRENPQLAKLRHPLVFVSPTLAQELGILHPKAGVAVRATFIVDPEGIVRFASANDLSVGRNADEIVRVLDALQTGALCACNWKKGEAPVATRTQGARS